LSKSTIEKSLESHIDKIQLLSTAPKTGVIASKSLLQVCEILLSLYFYNTRGRNELDDRDILAIYGNTQINQNAVEDLTMAFFGDDASTRHPEYSLNTYKTSQQYLMRDGNPAQLGQNMYMFEDDTVQRIQDYLEYGEFIQSTGRLRYSEREQRYLILCSSRPAPIYVDTFKTFEEITDSFLENLHNGIDVGISNDYLILAKYLTRTDTPELKISSRMLMRAGLPKKKAESLAGCLNHAKLLVACEHVDDFYNLHQTRKGSFDYYQCEPKVTVDMTAFIASLRKTQA
jgi:hypothetical protein